MIYLWFDPLDYPEERLGRYEREISPDQFLLRRGKKLEVNEFSEPTVTFRFPRKTMLQYDCLCNGSGLPLINDRIKTVLENIAPNDVQFFKAKVICSDGALEGYQFLNVTNKVVGMDREKSRYEDNGMYTSFTYLTYKPNCMGEHLIARDAEYLGHILVSEELKKVFDTERFTGIRLVRPEDYYTDLYGAHPSTPRGDVWNYINRNYKRYLLENDLFEEFSQEGEDVAEKIAEQHKDGIFLNRCPNCGNLKITPKAKVCLKCGESHEPNHT
ncbi:MAG: DUF1629 domain-containing protein [Pseudomonadota bacterium]|nr:hypothetical protein [Gammaproteobacteria bacterium]